MTFFKTMVRCSKLLFCTIVLFNLVQDVYPNDYKYTGTSLNGLDPVINRVDSVLLELPYDGSIELLLSHLHLDHCSSFAIPLTINSYFLVAFFVHTIDLLLRVSDFALNVLFRHKF